jgi:hypothetical protein
LSEPGEASLGIKIIAIWILVTGIIIIAYGFGVVFLVPIVYLFPFLYNLGGGAIILGFIHLGLAYGFWVTNPWALYAYGAILVIGIIFNLFFMNWIGIIISVAILGYLYFERASFFGYL